ncbi:MAG TPA: glycosyltransferase family 2 protein [Candidatus Limnocylindrales bacterium]|nr:glycosyltransferase family 2 protein [Candidatus Limnocylindrales bacterium]
MDQKLSGLSIFFPFWNEEQNIEQVVLKAIPVAEKVSLKWEIIMVDDGSTDDTLKIAKKLASKDERLKVVSLHPNRGYGAALQAGLEKARHKYIVFTDGDGQFNFLEVTKFIKKIENADMVIGFRQVRRDSNRFRRLLLMNLLKIWDLIFFKLRFKDIDCGFKMIRRSALDKILPLRSEGAMITTEILAKANRKKLKIEEVGITHYSRQHGDQSGANIPVILRAILESFILWYDLHYGRT